MSRAAVFWLFLFAISARAQDPLAVAEEQIENEQFVAAMRTLEALRNKPDADDELLIDELLVVWGDAVRGVARDIQRERGYPAALDLFEQHLVTNMIVDYYVETCICAGAEERGLRHVAALPEPLRGLSARAEFNLHWARLDFAAMEKRAREVKWPKWIKYAVQQQEMRKRLDSRRQRGWIVALLGSLALVGGTLFVGWRVTKGEKLEA